MSELLRNARSTSLIIYFLPVSKNLLDGMITQGGSKYMLLKQIRKAIDIQRLFRNILWLQRIKLL